VKLAMEILRQDAQTLAVATADGQVAEIGPPGPTTTGLDLAARRSADGWEVSLTRPGKALVLARGLGWQAREAHAYVALCLALAGRGHQGEEIRAHGVERLRFPPPTAGSHAAPAPLIRVPEYKLPPAAQLAVAAGASSVRGGGRFIPDAAAPAATRWVARAAWPLVVAAGVAPAVVLAGTWLPRWQRDGDAFMASPEGLAGAALLVVAGLMALVGVFGWVRQLQQASKAAASGRATEGLYLLDDALVIKQPVGCTYLPRGRLCGAALRQPLPPFGGTEVAIAYQAEDGKVELCFYEGGHPANPGAPEREILLALEDYIQAWRRAWAAR
jgi:hypothetical protein